MGYDYGHADQRGQWIVDGQPANPPFAPGDLVRVNQDLVTEVMGYGSMVGTVRHLAWVDDFTFRVEFADGGWGKFASWELEHVQQEEQ